MSDSNKEIPAAFIIGGCALISTDMQAGWPMFMAGIAIALAE